MTTRTEKLKENAEAICTAVEIKSTIIEYKIRNNISDQEFRNLVKKAELWHNPRNWKDRGADLKKKLGVEYLFDDALEKEGLSRSRYYFPFKDTDTSSWVKTAIAFLKCKNYKSYSEAWKKHAPGDINSEIIYLCALISMTTRGMEYEKNYIKKNNLIPSTADEDYKFGIDAWTADGKPVQIKSPATQHGM